jgi:hypothetical protein
MGIFRGIFRGILQGMHIGMPKVNLKTHFKKIMLSLSLYCHVFSVGMKWPKSCCGTILPKSARTFIRLMILDTPEHEKLNKQISLKLFSKCDLIS